MIVMQTTMSNILCNGNDSCSFCSINSSYSIKDSQLILNCDNGHYACASADIYASPNSNSALVSCGNNNDNGIYYDKN